MAHLVNSSENHSKADYNNDNYEENENYFELDYDTCLIILSFLIVGINVLVIALFVNRRPLRTKTNTLLVSLAVSDLMMGLFGIPTFVACNAFARNPTLAPSLCYTAVVVFQFISVSTILHIFAITIERFILVMYPFKYISIVNRKRLLVTISAVWFISLFVALIQLSWQGDFRLLAPNPKRLRYGVIYSLMWFIAFFVLPLCVMVFIYCRIFKVIRHQAKEIRKFNNIGNSTQNSSRPLAAESRAIVIFGLMLGIFVACWLTWYIGAMAEYHIIVLPVIPEDWLSVFDFFRFLTSFINPFLYTFLKHDFRQALNSVLPCRGSTKSRKKKRHEFISTVTKV